MRFHQRGLGAVQVLVGIAAAVLVATIAVPKYQDFVVRSKISEAFNVTGDSKTKLTEFYIMKNRFPKTEREIDSIQTDMFSPPEFVKEVVIKGRSETNHNDVLVQVYFKEGTVPGDGFNDQYLYLAGNTSAESGALVEWSCGLEGIEDKFMPSHCGE